MSRRAPPKHSGFDEPRDAAKEVRRKITAGERVNFSDHNLTTAQEYNLKREYLDKHTSVVGKDYASPEEFRAALGTKQPTIREPKTEIGKELLGYRDLHDKLARKK